MVQASAEGLGRLEVVALAATGGEQGGSGEAGLAGGVEGLSLGPGSSAAAAQQRQPGGDAARCVAAWGDGPGLRCSGKPGLPQARLLGAQRPWREAKGLLRRWASHQLGLALCRAASSATASGSGFVAAAAAGAAPPRRRPGAGGEAGGGAGEGAVVYARGPIGGLPEEHASRRERFAELDTLQPGWTVELRARGAGVEGAPLDAVFYSPAGERVGAYANARRLALAAHKEELALLRSGAA